MKQLVLIVLIVFGFYQWWSSKEVVHTPGIMVDQQPYQRKVSLPEFSHNNFRITPLAEFSLTARVLSREDYSFDEGAKLSPVDLALGWGAMSDSQVIEQLNISQSNRFYYWRWQGQPPIPQNQIIQSSSNMHLIPADEYIAEQLDEIRKGNIVQLDGLLIEANRSDGWRWRSSLSRKDTGNGACELFFVKQVIING